MTPSDPLRNPGDPATLPAVTLVTGFLGAGKTTWLSDILREPGGLKLAVIVNDVGAVNIDAALIRKIDDKKGTGPTTIELSNGCICCSVRDELAESVAELAARREHDHILIECSGVAEPQPIARLFTERNHFGRSLGDFARLHTVVAIVDTPELLRHCGQGETGTPVKRRFVNPDERPRPLAELMLQQIEGADLVALNKTDLIEPHAGDEAEAIVRAVNARAEIYRTIKSRLPAGIWPGPARVATDANPPATWMRVLNQARGQAGLIPAITGAGAGVRPATAVLTRAESSATKYGLQTFLFAARRALDETRFEALLARGLPGVVRAKGFFWANGRPDDIGFVSLAGGIVTIEPAGTWAAALRDHGVLTLQEIPAGIRALWQEPHGDRRQEIVFIGRDLDEAALRADLEACLLPG
jgi:G3E family GTPase